MAQARILGATNLGINSRRSDFNAVVIRLEVKVKARMKDKQNTKPESATDLKGRLDALVSCADMVRDYLERNGYDGLVDEGRECACCLEDLMPCGGEYAMTCEAGYRIDGCTKDCGNGCDFHIFPGKDHRGS